MEVAANANRLLYTDQFGREGDTVGMMLISNPYSFQTLIDGMDKLVLVVRKSVDGEIETEHGILSDDRVLVKRVTPDTLERWIVSGDHRNVIPWLVSGEVLSDPLGYLSDLRHRLNDWPDDFRERKLLCEFSRFIRTYLLANQDLKDGQVFDAFSHILESLHCWAHIALVEESMHPELTVWEQMRRVNPGIYKLYEELTTSAESMEKRVQLLLLACEFSVWTKMESSCALLIRILASREQPWSVNELFRHPKLTGLPLDLSLILQKLATRGCIREVAKPGKPRGTGMIELKYTASGETRNSVDGKIPESTKKSLTWQGDL